MRKLYRNIAIVTSVFILALTVMLGVSYYQMQQVSPLETGVMETLKELNETNVDNEVLQQQIRELDLLSRKAYFVKEGQLKMGIYLLLGMAIVLALCLNLYYKETKNLPEKEYDPIDERMGCCCGGTDWCGSRSCAARGLEGTDGMGEGNGGCGQRRADGHAGTICRRSTF